jgi:hypothetical protein
MLLACVCSFATTIKTTPQREKFALVYNSQIGVQEATGHNDGVQVEAYQRATGNHKGDYWCASFVAWCLKECNLPIKGNGMALSFFRKPYVVWTKDNGIRSFDKLAAVRGNFGGVYFSNLHRIGHIFIIDNIQNDYVVTVEGNASNNHSRNGTGVYKLKRRIRNIYSVSNHIDYKPLAKASGNV